MKRKENVECQEIQSSRRIKCWCFNLRYIPTARQYRLRRFRRKQTRSCDEFSASSSTCDATSAAAAAAAAAEPAVFAVPV